MGPYSIYGLVVFLLCIIGSRFLAEKGLARLSPEQKVELLSRFAGQRKYGLLPLVGLLVAFFVAMRLFPEHSFMLVVALLVHTVVYTLGVSIMGYRSLAAMDCPRFYIRTYLGARIVSTLGMILLFLSIVVGG